MTSSPKIMYRKKNLKLEKKLASATSVGATLMAVALLKVAEAIKTAKGGEGGEEVNEEKIATDSEVNEVLDKYFNDGNSTAHTSGDTSTVENDEVATDEEVEDVLNDYFN